MHGVGHGDVVDVLVRNPPILAAPEDTSVDEGGDELLDEEGVALGALDGGHALLYPSGMGAVTTVILTMLRSGGTIALAAGAYYGHRVLFDHLAPWGVHVVEFDQTGPPPDESDLILVEAPAASAIVPPGRSIVSTTVVTAPIPDGKRSA